MSNHATVHSAAVSFFFSEVLLHESQIKTFSSNHRFESAQVKDVPWLVGQSAGLVQTLNISIITDHRHRLHTD